MALILTLLQWHNENHNSWHIWQKRPEMNELEGLSAARVLDFYLTASDEASAEAALGELLKKHATVRIKMFFFGRVDEGHDHSNHGFTKLDAEDLASQAMFELTRALQHRRAMIGSDPISSLNGYILSICKSVYANFWRQRFAEYAKLANRIRYLLKRCPAIFASIRTENGKVMCSLTDSPTNRSFHSKLEIIDHVKEARHDHPLLDEATLLRETLLAAHGWLLQTETVDIVAELRGIKDIPPNGGFGPEDEQDDEIDGSGDAYTKHQNHYELTFLWHEIRGLPRFQRLALLYNLRDENGAEVNSVWFESSVATLEEIADQFEVTPEAMSELLIELPFKDRQIAETLGIEDEVCEGRLVRGETKVGNLRKAARDYLRRRREGKQRRHR